MNAWRTPQRVIFQGVQQKLPAVEMRIKLLNHCRSEKSRAKQSANRPQHLFERIGELGKRQKFHDDNTLK